MLARPPGRSELLPIATNTRQATTPAALSYSFPPVAETSQVVLLLI